MAGIEFKHLGKKITPVALSTVLGHYCLGMLPYMLYPEQLKLFRLVRETGTTVFSKSSTFYRRKGNWRLFDSRTWKYIQRLDNKGMQNAFGLTNLGLNWNSAILALSYDFGVNAIPNFFPNLSGTSDMAALEAVAAADMLKRRLGKNFWAVKLNPSCPNARCDFANNAESVKECILAVKAKYPSLVTIVKTGISHPIEAIQEWERAGAIIQGINSIPYSLVYPEKISPMSNVGGGAISGGPATWIAFKRNREIRKAIKGPMICSCGIISKPVAMAYFEIIGADVISLCSLAIHCPREAADLIYEYNI
jgi:dihydroorotate dehydrogenase